MSFGKKGVQPREPVSQKPTRRPPPDTGGGGGGHNIWPNVGKWAAMAVGGVAVLAAGTMFLGKAMDAQQASRFDNVKIQPLSSEPTGNFGAMAGPAMTYPLGHQRCLAAAGGEIGAQSQASLYSGFNSAADYIVCLMDTQPQRFCIANERQMLGGLVFAYFEGRNELRRKPADPVSSPPLDDADKRITDAISRRLEDRHLVASDLPKSIQSVAPSQLKALLAANERPAKRPCGAG